MFSKSSTPFFLIEDELKVTQYILMKLSTTKPSALLSILTFVATVQLFGFLFVADVY